MWSPESLARIEVDGRRYYETPMGRLPSVTTVLSATDSAPQQHGWDRSVGSRTAVRQAQAAAARGRQFHAQLAAYLGEGRPPRGQTTYFQSLAWFLSRIEDVLLVEAAVWHSAGFAGSVDCLARIDGQLTVIDWKTSTRSDPGERMAEHHAQVAAYRAAISERYGVPVERGWVVVAVPHRNARIYEPEQPDRAWGDFLARLRRFHNQPQAPQP